MGQKSKARVGVVMATCITLFSSAAAQASIQSIQEFFSEGVDDPFWLTSSVTVSQPLAPPVAVVSPSPVLSPVPLDLFRWDARQSGFSLTENTSRRSILASMPLPSGLGLGLAGLAAFGLIAWRKHRGYSSF